MSVLKLYTCEPLGGVCVPGIADNDIVWFKARSVLDYLSYTSKGILPFTRHLPDQCHYKQLKDLDSKERMDMDMYFVDAYAIKVLIQKGRKTKCTELASTNGIDVLTRYEPKEIEILSRLSNIFDGMKIKSVQQYKVKTIAGVYKLDMYLEDLRIAIEVDEFGHSDRSHTKEVNRQRLVEQKLQCKFFRMNPDKSDFKFDFEIGRLMKLICDQ